MAFEYRDVLAGPIVRRVEPSLACAWVALRKAARVTLRLWDGLELGDTSREPLFTGTTVNSRAVGEHLHFALARVVLPQTAPSPRLESNTLYSYDVQVEDLDDGVTRGLGAMGLLVERKTNGEAHLPLGFEPGRLPGFALPPTDISKLRLAEASCRLPHGDADDAMPYLDDLFTQDSAWQDADKRLHQLFLTGDQVYADEVAFDLLDLINRVGNELLSGDPAKIIERLPFLHEDGKVYPVPLSRAFFPPARRQRFIRQHVKFTSGYGDSHVLGVGEYCALYLLAWSSTLWPGTFFADKLAARWAQVEAYQGARAALRASVAAYEPWKDKERPKLAGLADLAREKLDYAHGWRLLPSEWRRIDVALTAEDRRAEWGEEWKRFEGAEALDFPTREPPDTLADVTAPLPPTLPDDIDEAVRPALLRAVAKSLTPSWYAGTYEAGFGAAEGDTLFKDKALAQLRALQNYYKSLPKLRRVLANVPTYMMFDDHEVTDDWNITEHWIHDVNQSEVGRGAVRNGLLAFALFQGWGNDPRYFESLDVDKTPGTQLLDEASKLFFTGNTLSPSGPSSSVCAKLDRLLGLGATATPPEERVRWHFHVGGHGYEVLSLDIRTWRGFKTGDGPPELLPLHALHAQVPADPVYSYGPPPAGQGLTFVISGMPVLGFTPSEYLAQPTVNLVDSLLRPPTGVFQAAKADYFVGKYDHDPEPWDYQEDIFEALLARLASYGRVVFLSGETHYSVVLKLDYWRLDARPEPRVSRFLQLTSSGAKNVPELGISSRFRSGIIERLASMLAMPQVQMGWVTSTLGPPLVPPDGQSFNRLVQERNASSPAIVPLAALPEGTRQRYGPAWTWKKEFLLDTRTDGARLTGVTGVPAFSEPETPGAFDVDFVDGVARRHFWQSVHGPPRLVTMVGTVGLITVDASSGAPVVTYGVLQRLRGLPGVKPRAYSQVSTPMDASAEVMPTPPPTL